MGFRSGCSATRGSRSGRETRSSRPEGGKTDPADRPLSSLVMQIATFDTSAGITQHMVQVEALVKAETLVQPLLVLTHERPAAWPM